MPDLGTVKTAVDMVSKTMSRQCSARNLDFVVKDMEQHPREYGAWPGPNWDAGFLRSELAQRLWNLPDHPDRIPKKWIGLPFKTLRNELLAKSQGWEPPTAFATKAEHDEWLCACACNRRHGGNEWRQWLNDPERWRLRYLDDNGYTRIRQWESGAA